MIKRLGPIFGPLKFAAASSLAVALISLFLPNYYRSDARILPSESRVASGGLGGLAAAAATMGFNVPGGEGNDANFIDILQSRWIGERLLMTEFTFKDRAWRFGSERERKTTLFDYIHEKNIDKGMRELRKILTVSKDLKSKVITISAETTSPTLSQAIVQKSTQLLEQFAGEKGRTRGGAKASFAEARLVEARAEMNRVEEDLLRFLEANRNFQVSSDPRVRLRGLRLEAELKLHQQVVTTLALNREQALMEEKNDMRIINTLDPGNLPIEKSRPSRAVIVIGVFLSVLAATSAWAKRDVLKAMVQAD